MTLMQEKDMQVYQSATSFKNCERCFIHKSQPDLQRQEEKHVKGSRKKTSER